MSLSRGDVVLVDYQFTDRTGSKVRPALVETLLTFDQHFIIA